MSVICCRLGGHIQERVGIIVITGVIIVHIYEDWKKRTSYRNTNSLQRLR